MRILLFQIYGNRSVYHLELTYSILSAARFLKTDPAGIRLVLAADAANHRPDLPVEHLDLTPETLNEWQLDGSYNHAVKVFALDYAVRKFHAPVILVDSDTIIRDHPKRMFERIKPGTTLMHMREGRLGDSVGNAEWKALIDRSGGSIAGLPVTLDSVMYNSGVVGIHPQDAPIMAKVEAIMRGIRENSSMFTAEQLAYSLVFDARTKLSLCDDLVEHYWDGPRAYYHYQMQRMFPWVIERKGIDDPNMILPPLERTLATAWRHRLAARIKRLQRSAGPEYGMAYIAYLSALSVGDSNPGLANVWATEALNMLKWGMRDEQVQPEDFIRFMPVQIGLQHWMQADLRKRWQSYWSNVFKIDSASQ